VAFRNFAIAPKTGRCLHFEPDDLQAEAAAAAAVRAVGGLSQKCNIHLRNY